MDTPACPDTPGPTDLHVHVRVDRLLDHVGHDVAVVTYGTAATGPVNVAIECEACGEVIGDTDLDGGVEP